MEEIKNWWGVFGLFGCVTVVSSSLERRCHRQGSFTALTDPAISTHWHASREGYSLAHTKSARLKIRCMSVCAIAYAFLYWAMNKGSFFLYHDLCRHFPWSALFCSAFFRVNLLVGLVTQSSYSEPVSTPITSTTFVCWNGLGLLFNMLFLLDCSQLYSVSTVPGEQWGVAQETSVSYPHYWCSVSADL